MNNSIIHAILFRRLRRKGIMYSTEGELRLGEKFRSLV
jgi:hypothetical protein